MVYIDAHRTHHAVTLWDLSRTAQKMAGEWSLARDQAPGEADDDGWIASPAAPNGASPAPAGSSWQHALVRRLWYTRCLVQTIVERKKSATVGAS
jgi:hypothetical protein